VDSKRRPIGWGTNGLSRFSSDSEAILNVREEKYKRVLHAEENAIYNATKDTEGATAFVTHPPCLHCCHVLSQNGIIRVVTIKPRGEFAKRWHLDETEKELRDLGIEFNAYTHINKTPLENASIKFDELLKED
jgi:dCMP deaminase